MTIFQLLRKADAFTAANAALGFLAITYISDAKYAQAEVLIFLAVICDGLDGIVARRFGNEGESMGDYLDIMADYLSFCVAPSILFYQTHYDPATAPFLTRPEDVVVGIASGLMALLGLLRLARHVTQDGPTSGRFTGLPTTAAGFFVTLLVAAGGLGDLVSGLLVSFVAVLMVSEIPYPKVRGPMAKASGLLVVIAAVAIALPLPMKGGKPLILLAALVGATAYAVSGLAFALLRVPIGHAPDPVEAKAPPAPPTKEIPSQEVDLDD